MNDLANKILLWIATIIIVVAYLFWEVIEVKIGYNIYFSGIALFILMISFYVWINKPYTISFMLMLLAFGNFMDELFFDNTTLYLSEIFYSVIVIVFSLVYNKNKKCGKTVNDKKQ